MCEKRSGSRKRSTRTVPGCTRARGRCGRGRRASRARRGPSRSEQRLGVAVARRDRARDRVQLGAACLALDDRLRRGADQREPVELEQEEIRRRVDAAERAVELERGRGRRPLGALRDDDLERVAGADVAPSRVDASLVLRLVGEAARAAPRVPPAARGTGGCGRAASASASPRSTSAMPRTWSKRTSVSATTKRLSGRPGPVVGQRHRRLELRDVVVRDVADDRLPSASASSSVRRAASRQPTNE